ncbi:MAG: hypothetical protein KF791_16975 [Verrucomicrobiae bacterium]|nr:hypothetical protein [Verrucomicrobiae bacterium]
MNATPNLTERLPRSWFWLPAILGILTSLTGTGGTGTNTQALSVASTWQLPVEVKATCFALSPDAGSLALMHTNGYVEIWGTAARLPQRRIAVQTLPITSFFRQSLAFSPDGQWLAILSGGPLRLVPVSGATNELLVGDARDSVTHIKFSADSRHVLVCGKAEYVVSLPEGKPVGTLTTSGTSVPKLTPHRPLARFGKPSRPIRTSTSALSPDGSEVALGQEHLEVERWDVASGQCLGYASLDVTGMPLEQSPVSVLNYSSRNKQLVAVLNGSQWDVVLVEPDGKWRTLLHQTPWGQLQTSPRRAIIDAFFTPDGREVVVLAEKLAEDKPGSPFVRAVGPEVLFLDSVTGAVTRRLDSAEACFFGQAWISADGLQLTLLRRHYSKVPRTFAEWNRLRTDHADLAAALLTVSLDREPKPGNP